MDRIPRKKKKQIPKDTVYCYTPKNKIIYPKDGLPYYTINSCGFYKHVNGLYGHCNLLNCEVTDQVKECGERHGKF